MTRVDAASGMGLRHLVVVAALVLALMTLGVAGSLVMLTTSLHEESGALRETVRRARSAREAQLELRLHHRSADPTERADLESKLRQALADDFGTSGRANSAARQAGGAVERYFATTLAEEAPSGRAPALEAALEALEPVVGANVADADEALARASRLDRLGNLIGLSAAALVVAVLTLVVLWTRRAVVRPMLALSDAMERFGGGDLAVRGVPSGVAELRRMVEQFNAMGDTLARQHRTRVTHLAGVAHDLRNPLAALQMSAALMDPDRPLPPESSIRRALALVRRQVSRLNRMVDDLLDAARIDAGDLALDPRDTDLRDVVQDVAALFKDASDIHTIRVELPQEPLLLRCDPLRIEQTLSNLVSNAIKYSPGGGAVRIRGYLENGMAKISVSDEGIGIPSSDVDRIWEPFRRTGVSAETIPGVGLGLWVAKRIADAHQGRILVESALGEGSTFTLVLPLTAASADAARDLSRQQAGVPSRPVAEPHG